MQKSYDRNKMTETEYLLYLRSRQEEMKTDILTLFGKKMKTAFLSEYQVYLALDGKYHLDRIGENGTDVILYGVCKNLLRILAANGKLVESEEGQCYRSKNQDKEKGAA